MICFNIYCQTLNRLEVGYELEFSGFKVCICYCNLRNNIAIIDVITTKKEFRRLGMAIKILKEIEQLGYEIEFPSDVYLSDNGKILRDKWIVYKSEE